MQLSLLKIFESNLKLQRNACFVLSIALLAGNLVLSVILLTAEKQIILVPTGLNKESTISSINLSNSYLEEMSIYFISKFLDLTPHNIDYQTNIVLTHTEPANYSKMKEFFIKEKKKYVEYNLATYFVIKTLEVENLTVTAHGTLLSQFANHGKTQEETSYRITYAYKSGLLTITNFEFMVEKND